MLASGTQPSGTPSDDSTMVVAVSRDKSLLEGGLSSADRTSEGRIAIEPIALLSASGVWHALPCRPGEITKCKQFEKDYLSHPHTYKVVSDDGHGANVHSGPVKLTECFFFTGIGRYTEGQIENSAIAASADGPFGLSNGVKALGPESRTSILRALARLDRSQLDSLKSLKIETLQIEGETFAIVRRNFDDIEANHNSPRLKFFFGIGQIRDSGFQLLHWKKNIEDADERIIGVVRLLNGREFLITSVSDPESQSFRIYGVVDHRLKLVFSGGGSSC